MSILKNGAKTLLVLSFMILTQCSQGELSDKRNYYQSVFGIYLGTNDNPNRGGIIGRVVLKNGSPAVNAQVYIHGQRAFTLTNQKGGFYFPNLDPGMYQVYVVLNDFVGANFSMKVKANKVVEDKDVVLQELLQITGKVTTDDVTQGQAKVSIDGSPFQSDCDNDGFYLLKIPKGTYRLSAKHLLYEPFESEYLEFEENTNLNIEMQPYEFPSARIGLESEDGFIVRGHTTRLHIEPVKGVQSMRFTSVTDYQDTSPLQNYELDKWYRLEKELEINVKHDGQTQITMVFSDAFGKISEPQTVAFYNTSLDKSWRVLYGIHDDPLEIKSGEKIFFLDHASLFGLPHRRQYLPPKPNTIHESLYDETVFTGPVTIQKGALIKGGAGFLGDLTLNGTKEEPILWEKGPQVFDFMASMLVIASPSASIQNVKFERIGVAFVSQGESQYSKIQDTEFIKSEIAFEGSAFDTSKLTFDRAVFRNTDIRAFCGETKSSREMPVKRNLNLLSIKNSDLHNSGLTLDCVSNEELEYGFQFELNQNNFFKLEPTIEGKSRYYFSRSAEAGIPSENDMSYKVGQNYFFDKHRLHSLVSEDGWPAFFGIALETAIVR